jgi:hypothetical protein
MDRDALQKLIEDDDLGLLTIKPKASPEATAAERLRTSFIEIIDFVRKNGREPEPNKADLKEMMLFSRLSGLRQDPKKIESLQQYDELNLLSDKMPVESIEDIFMDDNLGLLNDDTESIFTLKNVPATKSINNLPEYIAKRKPCQNFNKYEHLFKQCQHDLSQGIRQLIAFSRGTQIDIGQFFILKGVLVYVASEHEREDQPGAEPGKMNDRLRCIFENGTESDMLRRSLAARLYEENGQRVSQDPSKLFQTVNDINDEDRQTGFVYVLRSLSDKNEIKSLKNLYKIGFSHGPVEERIRNATKEATYLMAPVSIITAYQCYNLNPQKLEHLLHTFFGAACLNVEVTDTEGRRCVPKEWFIAPLEIITTTVQLLISGEIVDYGYNAELQKIEPK